MKNLFNSASVASEMEAKFVFQNNAPSKSPDKSNISQPDPNPVTDEDVAGVKNIPFDDGNKETEAETDISVVTSVEISSLNIDDQIEALENLFPTTKEENDMAVNALAHAYYLKKEGYPMNWSDTSDATGDSFAIEDKKAEIYYKNKRKKAKAE